ncbi:MAG: hypothetical protein R3199_00445 [Gemmatimonadota bacterium]|nr:hypothetical protein [Gemmatimonadota bacterium]
MRRPLLPLALMLAVGTMATPLRAQGPPISELERLAEQREERIAVLEDRLDRLEARRDSLIEAKRSADPGSARFETVSNRILENAEQIRPVQRELRTLREQVRSLKTELFQRYNLEIAETQTRIDALKARGLTPRESPELRRLTERMPELLRARGRLAAELEEEQDALYLPAIVYDPTDTARELQNKIAASRDAIDRIDERLGEIEERIQNLNRTERMRREAERLQRDLELWGDDRSAQSGSEIEAILEQQRPGARDRRAGANPFEDPREEIRRLRGRYLELEERRDEFVRKAALFAELLERFYR